MVAEGQCWLMVDGEPEPSTFRSVCDVNPGGGRIIAVEEHFATTDYRDRTADLAVFPGEEPEWDVMRVFPGILACASASRT